ncbi:MULTISPECIES: hypothetical protein [Paraburkholderia]|uniref:Sel1 repeat family protein n=2 Tax=Burkholderiaceae TaxID=119060 RepID=A0AAP5BN68_9BURK|nr:MULTISPECIES: hypothetical protein [Paraburkholderia]MDN7153982.1 hypothetical protein [Paraburkholderia sp. WS6]MCX4151050.1 hypothetical protein [Paraburkholderia madseniana]MCX4176690.1 hypothetical protein [Paraburkholderia madseniana]MDQ6412864.1 hypothetical protein [Paraburkholderia madseniana]MDQ6464681.1 hypothetical protein [Paraburkholderia madseniana]
MPTIRDIAIAIPLLLAAQGHAQQAPFAPDAVKGIADSTFDSPVFKTMVQRLQQQSASAIQSIGGAELARVKASLPKGADLGHLRYGTHNVVSNDGDAVVTLIIQAAHETPTDRAPILARLADLAGQRIPEALNVEGFLSEYGIWGTPQSMPRALQMYRSAASLNYQPAVYNLALAAAYGKGSQADVNNATALISEAYSIAPDPSGRVCGFGAFLSYRQGDREESLRYASKGCMSDLASIPKALYDDQVVPAQRIMLLRASIATGVDDGYGLLERTTRAMKPDSQYLWCKYALVNKYRRSLVGNRLMDDALSCYHDLQPAGADPRQELIRRETTIPGIVGFVPIEIRALQKLRESNHFHYAWSVPYLPFRQDDADLFEPFVKHAKS